MNGTNFVAGSVVKWNGSNRTTHYTSATQLTADITAADIATAGTVPVTVFNTGAAESNPQTFTVSNVPPPESITPNVLGNSKNNKAVPVEIIRATGPAFALKAKVQLIQVGALKPKKKTVKIVTLTATEIDGLANVVKLPPGPYDVVVTNKDKSVWTLPSGMTVTPAPTIDKAVKPATNPTPPSAQTNTTPSITITGTNFQPNATVKVYLIKKGIETDIPVSSIVVVNSNTITCSLDLTGAAVGSWKGLITNPDDNGQGAFKFKVLK